MSKVTNKKRNWKIGKYNGRSMRKRPSPDRVSNFFDEMGAAMSDYDVYLWGSWPDKRSTWDLDILLHNANAELDTEEMEDIMVKGLNSSLTHNNFLADIGFNNSPRIIPFNESWNKYHKTGRETPNKGYIYADKWYMDDTLIKDRSALKNGAVKQLDNDMLEIVSLHPYPKMLFNNGKNFDKHYKNKPTLIKERRKLYG